MIRILLITILLLSSMLAVQSAPAQQRPNIGTDSGSQFEQNIADIRARIEVLVSEFNLTEAQKIHLLVIFESTIYSTQPVLEEMFANRDEIFLALTANPANMEEVGDLAIEQGDLFSDLAKLNAEAFVEVRGVLNDDQLGLLTEIEAAVRSKFVEAATRVDQRAAGRVDRRTAILGGQSPARRGQFAELADQLLLSAAQRAEIRAIIQSAVPEVLNVLSEMAANREALREAIILEDSESIDSLTSAQGELFAELVLIRAETINLVSGQLSGEQLELLVELRETLQHRVSPFLIGM